MQIVSPILNNIKIVVDRQVIIQEAKKKINKSSKGRGRMRQLKGIKAIYPRRDPRRDKGLPRVEVRDSRVSSTARLTRLAGRSGST